jgi:flagellar hook assembly protein FlgD
VTATDDLGRPSQAERAFSVNSTLLGLAVTGSRISVELARAATLTIRIERSGTVLRTLLSKRPVDSGATSSTWDGRFDGGLLAPRGTYVVRVTATNQVGTAELTTTITRR